MYEDAECAYPEQNLGSGERVTFERERVARMQDHFEKSVRVMRRSSKFECYANNVVYHKYIDVNKDWLAFMVMLV